MFRVTINDDDSAAFADSHDQELLSILDDLRSLIANGRRSGILKDANGNTVGTYHFYKEEEVTTHD